MDLTTIPTAELHKEIERREAAKNKVKKLADEPIFKCDTCGLLWNRRDINFFADNIFGGIVWHRACTDRPNKELIGRMSLIGGVIKGIC